MKKLNQVVYQRLLTQAEEAKEFGLTKLANGVMNSIGATPRDEEATYSYTELKEAVYNQLWKIATEVITYHDLTNVDIQEVDKDLTVMADKLLVAMENSLSVAPETIGKLEPKLPGETNK